MSAVRSIAYFEELLKADPDLPFPEPLAPRITNYEILREYKSALRAYDRARMRLGIRTPEQIQEQNSPIRVEDRKFMKLDWSERLSRGTKRSQQKIHA